MAIAIAISISIAVAVAVAVKKVINHAARLALRGSTGEGRRRSSGGKCILLRLLVRATFGCGSMGSGGWQTCGGGVGQHKSRHKGVQKY